MEQLTYTAKLLNAMVKGQEIITDGRQVAIFPYVTPDEGQTATLLHQMDDAINDADEAMLRFK